MIAFLTLCYVAILAILVWLKVLYQGSLSLTRMRPFARAD
jgi:hypothetical protein